MKIFAAFFYVWSIILSAHNESSIAITLVNNTERSFSFSDAQARPGAELTIDRHQIGPHESALITGTIHNDVDLIGTISFNNGDDRFRTYVRRLKHYGRPSFVMIADGIRTVVDDAALKFNTDGIPTHLSHTSATIIMWPANLSGKQQRRP